MIYGVGVDIVQVGRIERWLASPELIDRFFNPVESRLLAGSFKQKAQSLAARFAAKEAFAKALGTGFRGLNLKSIWIESDKLGKPILCTEGTASDLLKGVGSTRVHVSLSHEKSYAVAMIVIEVEDGQ